MGKKKHKWLKEALIDLKGCSDEAKTDGIEVPSGTAFNKAKKIIQRLSEFEEEKPYIYPMEGREGIKGGEIFIDLQNPDRETSIVMVAESSGAGILFFQENREEAYKCIDDAEDLIYHLKEVRKNTAEIGSNRGSNPEYSSPLI